MGAGEAANRRVRQFRQTLLWPVQLLPIRPGVQIQRHWELLENEHPDNPWHEVIDEIAGGSRPFRIRDYNEFISFLPQVQRFLYGDGSVSADNVRRQSPMRVFRRSDISAVGVTLRAGCEPLLLTVDHVDLYFFYDLDIVLMTMEVYADNLSLHDVQDLLYRFGRAYPPRWDETGSGLHCPHRVEWLGGDGTVLAVSDFEKRDHFIGFTRRHRVAGVASHWNFLLKPLVLDASGETGALRYRQIEYHRMPLLAYVAIDDPGTLSRADLVRLGLVTAAGMENELPYSERHVSDFESTICYDRFWETGRGNLSTRYMCCGHALVVVGDARSSLFTDPEVGTLADFQHRDFLLFMIAHMQRAALLMFSNRLVEALDGLDIGNAESIKGFKRIIRQNFEIFLRFTHRYAFRELSDQAQIKALFQLCTRHLGTERLYAEVKQQIYDMSAYLDSDSLRRQANTILRLTVVTTFGLIGTVVTGFLGMNLLAMSELSLPMKALAFALVTIPTTAVTFYTIVKSKRLSDFLEALSDERLTNREKLAALVAVWQQRPMPMAEAAITERRASE